MSAQFPNGELKKKGVIVPCLGYSLTPHLLYSLPQLNPSKPRFSHVKQDNAAYLTDVLLLVNEI